MFDSGVSAKEFVEKLKAEADIAFDIENRDYLRWLNSLEQLLYREIIQEQAEFYVDLNTEIIFPYTVCEDYSPVRFEDIYSVFADGRQLAKSTVTSGVIFPDTFYKKNDRLCFNTRANEIRIVYIVRPPMKEFDGGNIKTSDDNRYNVKLPIEFLDLALAKCRGEAYKLANENVMAANWLNDYNLLLESFKLWAENKKPLLGM